MDRVKEESETPLADLQMKALEKQYTGNWIWRSVAALMATDLRNESPLEISRLLEVSVEDVLLAIEGLLDLGIIKRTDEGYERVLKFLFFSERQLDRAKLVSDHVLISSQLMGRLRPEGPEEGDLYRTGFIASSRETLSAFYEELDVLLKKFLQQSCADKDSEILMGLTISGIKICSPEKGSGL